MLYWQRLFTLSTQSLEFSLVNEFSVPSSGPHCGLKGLFFSELLCFLPLAHLIQIYESCSPEMWTSQWCFQARSFQRSVTVQTPQVSRSEPPPLLRCAHRRSRLPLLLVALALCPASESAFRRFPFVSSIFSALPG